LISKITVILFLNGGAAYNCGSANCFIMNTLAYRRIAISSSRTRVCYLNNFLWEEINWYSSKSVKYYIIVSITDPWRYSVKIILIKPKLLVILKVPKFF